jgi:hypothetical protein
MREIWVHTNRRALGIGMVLPLVTALLGAWAGAVADSTWLSGAGWALCGVSSLLAIALAMQLRQPRVAFQDGQVLFHLRSGPPIAVPVDLVEAFFLGQGPTTLPGARQGDSTVNLVARISQRDASFAQRDVKPALGNWNEHYVTMRGTWCEPLNGEVIRRLNRRLREVTERAELETAGGCAC